MKADDDGPRGAAYDRWTTLAREELVEERSVAERAAGERALLARLMERPPPGVRSACCSSPRSYSC